MSSPKKVEVSWVDSCSHKGAWLDAEDAKVWAGAGAVCVSAGFLVERNDRGITLAMSRNENGEGVNWGGVWFIPAGCVQKVKVLR